MVSFLERTDCLPSFFQLHAYNWREPWIYFCARKHTHARHFAALHSCYLIPHDFTSASIFQYNEHVFSLWADKTTAAARERPNLRNNKQTSITLWKNQGLKAKENPRKLANTQSETEQMVLENNRQISIHSSFHRQYHWSMQGLQQVLADIGGGQNTFWTGHHSVTGLT